jgi:hypothetical protein
MSRSLNFTFCTCRGVYLYFLNTSFLQENTTTKSDFSKEGGAILDFTLIFY